MAQKAGGCSPQELFGGYQGLLAGLIGFLREYSGFQSTKAKASFSSHLPSLFVTVAMGQPRFKE